RPMADEPGLVKFAHCLGPVPAGHHRHMGDMWSRAHRRHGGVDVARLELGVRMGVEHRAETLRVGAHRAFRSLAPCRAFTFASTTSQIRAAMSVPPNCATCLMPVGEVTLISVR